MHRALSLLTGCELVKAVLSQPQHNTQYKKIVARPVTVKGQQCIQLEQYTADKVFHLNVSMDSWKQKAEQLLLEYDQANIVCAKQTYDFYRLPNGKVRCKQKDNATFKTADLAHNRSKQYIIAEGMAIPALVDLGVFDSNYKIIKSKYDKYKQINRFVEIVDDALRNIDKESVKVLDFGCGKSYLTFVLYYYLKVLRNKNVSIVGYDLKSDVVQHCNEIAAKYGYSDGLKFVVGDVGDIRYTTDADIMVTLHACDTATDYALYHSISNNIPYVFSVPCCQHQINLSIKKGGDLDILLQHGLIKERTCALLTDAIRAAILQSCGYKTDVVEFVDMQHSPKNIMIRATLVSKRKPLPAQLLQLADKYGFEQKLLQLVTQQDK